MGKPSELVAIVGVGLVAEVVADLEGSFAAQGMDVAGGHHQIEVVVRASLFAEQGIDPQPPSGQ